MCGTLIAILLGIIFLDGLTVQFSLGAFGLVIDSAVILLAIAAGCAVGIIGALPPAIRCLRLPITEALKSN
jgi:ABC-type antimicrobial peptide transport system permease subunit